MPAKIWDPLDLIAVGVVCPKHLPLYTIHIIHVTNFENHPRAPVGDLTGGGGGTNSDGAKLRKLYLKSTLLNTNELVSSVFVQGINVIYIAKTCDTVLC